MIDIILSLTNKPNLLTLFRSVIFINFHRLKVVSRYRDPQLILLTNYINSHVF